MNKKILDIDSIPDSAMGFPELFRDDVVVVSMIYLQELPDHKYESMWIPNEYSKDKSRVNQYACKKCKFLCIPQLRTPYCPMCGAKMDPQTICIKYARYNHDSDIESLR